MFLIFNEDGYPDYLTDGCLFAGTEGIPCLMKLNNTDIPSKLVPFSKANVTNPKTGYVHFYERDHMFSRFLNRPEKYIDLLARYDGVISPDPTIVVNKSKCLNATSTYINRAYGYFLQKNGISVIPNIRWGDESTYDFAFSGIPMNSIVCISTLGAIKRDKMNSNALRNIFKAGLAEMIFRLNPKLILVYGYMPKDIFGPYCGKNNFIRFPSEIEKAHITEGRKNGHTL